MRISDWSSDVCSSDLRRQNGEPRGVPGEVGGRVGRLQIAPPLMRALGTGANEHEQRIDMDRDAPALGLAETQDRRARDELVLDDPVERARARDLLVQIGSASGRERVCQYV